MSNCQDNQFDSLLVHRESGPISSSMTDVLGTAGKLAWTDAHISYDKLKSCLTSAPTLTHPDFTRIISGPWWLSVKKFHGYIEGHSFKMIKDLASPKRLMSQKDIAGRLVRWRPKLQGFTLSIEHRRGRANVVPDVPSIHEGANVVRLPSRRR